MNFVIYYIFKMKYVYLLYFHGLLHKALCMMHTQSEFCLNDSSVLADSMEYWSQVQLADFMDFPWFSFYS